MKLFKTFLIPFLLLIGLAQSQAQNSLLAVDEASKDIGTLDQVYKINAEYVLQNNQAKNLYLLRADARKGIQIRTAKKTVLPGDTVVITVEFIPEQSGRFNEAIQLVTSADGQPLVLHLTGTIKGIKTDDKTACFYFKRGNRSGGTVPSEPIVVAESNQPRDVSNRIPDGNSSAPPPAPPKPGPARPQPTVSVLPPAPVAGATELDPALYKPNNVIFLVDVSSSMKDSMKLPLMKEALRTLITQLRASDKVTFITYADSVKLLREALSGEAKEELEAVVSQLKAKGMTKGNKAILYSLDIALKHYIPEGNNQIILATDGKFRFYSEDFQTWQQKQGDKTILLSTVAFGDDREAMDNLKEISKKGKGSFIRIRNRDRAKDSLLEEIKSKSKK